MGGSSFSTAGLLNVVEKQKNLIIIYLSTPTIGTADEVSWSSWQFYQFYL